MQLAYHYTDPKGFFGIVQTGAFWATDLRFLNDVSEVQYGLGLARKVIRDRRSAVDASQQRLLSVVEDALELKGTGPLSGARFAVSFAGDGDLITQWRAYAAFGAGYALGFDLDELRRVARCEPALYDHGTSVAQVAEVLDTLLRKVQGGRIWSEDARGEAALEAAERCIDLALFAKHPAFSDEREVRMLLEADEASYRVRDDEVIPYTSIDMRANDGKMGGLKRVVLGPLATARAEAGAADLLARYGYGEVSIRRSTIPFRG
jgi:hypothetical protein